MSNNKWNIGGVMRGQRKRLAAAVWLGSDVVLAEITTRTPVGETGNLKGNNSRREINDLRVRVFNNTSYAPHVEFGTPPHEIRVKNAKVLTDGKRFFGKVVQHPGTKAQPFMRTGYRAAKSKVKALFKRI